jgi:hypothetical protein
MRELDFQRRFEQVGMYAAWITALALAVSLSLDQFGSDHPLAPWLYWLLIGACACVGLGYTGQFVVNKKTGGRGLSTNAYVVQMAASTLALTAKEISIAT